MTARLAQEEVLIEEGNRSQRRWVLGVSCGAHALHDGFTDLLYVMLPVWQAQFGLSYSLIGIMRALYAGTMAGFQVPASMLAARLGGRFVLFLGTALAATGYLLAGASGGIIGLCAALVLGGLGSSTQHPIASSLVAGAYEGRQSRAAISTYNFAGDIGKMAVPALVSLLLTIWAWKTTLAWLGACGLFVAILVLLLLPATQRTQKIATEPAESASGSHETWGGFAPLLCVGIIDSATRMGFLTFLPFVLKAKGAALPTVGLALTLVFAGGAAGKLVCGLLGTRLGVLKTVWLTESLTAACILVALVLPLWPAMALLPVLGVALNGTSSVLYGTVPELAPPGRREKAFGIFYTGTIGGGALSPVAYGLLSDASGVPTAMVIVAMLVLSTLPLSWQVNKHLT